ncbi:hypothetical protein A3Q56_07497 [Intoshia linei]|uniref:Uncharacterized protein n=1 Tax=Intoshia linei TaxID=1819745 RepID=A0A177ARZ9_9BILA|nr:hypothetical protein A3Q56_07497 [Intoshia linei]
MSMDISSLDDFNSENLYIATKNIEASITFCKQFGLISSCKPYIVKYVHCATDNFAEHELRTTGLMSSCKICPLCNRRCFFPKRCV